jgi:hypothetical protein
MSLKRILALLLPLAILCAFLPAAAAEEDPCNRILWERETPVTADILSTETVFDNGSRQSEHYISYRPGGSARPELSYGDTIRKKMVFPEAVEGTEGRVLAGINGDYFVMATGMPLGIVIHEGELISSDAWNASFGFLEDGSAILGKPGLTLVLTSENSQCSVLSLNKNYQDGEFCLYSPAWGEQVPMNREYYCVELLPEEGQILTVGGELHCHLGEIRQLDSAAQLEEGKLLLCYSGPEERWQHAGLGELEPGTPLTLSVHADDERFEGCREALGCLFPLLSEGEVLSGLDEIDKNKAPRTAIGIREDGTVILYTADGRQSGYAIGLTLREVAERLLELGCVEGGALDGGASTVFGCQYPGEEDCSIRNMPSLGYLRETPQFLVLTAAKEAAGELEIVAVYCDEKVLLAGSSCVFSCGGCDKNGAPLLPEELYWSCDLGSVDENGVYVAPASAGEAAVSVRWGSCSGLLRIPVIDRPDELSIIREDDQSVIRRLRILPGTAVPLSVRAVWNGMTVCSQDELYEWTTEGEIGAVDGSGLFTATEKAAAGYLTVRIGEVSTRLQIQVTDTVICAEDFEQAFSGSAPGLTWSPESNRDKVKYGVGSLRLDYDLTAGSVTIPIDEYPTELGDSAGFWILSDGSGNNLYSVHDEITILLGQLDHPGWTQFLVNTREFGRIQALRIGGSGSGTLWLDQLMIFSTPEPDLEAPVIRLEESLGKLSGQIWDLAEGVLPESQLKLTADGQAYPFEYDPSSGLLSAEIPSADFGTRVILTAADRSGNYNSVSLLLNTVTAPSFSDMDGHWANSFVDHLKGMGVVNGRPAENGSAYFDPDSRITRAEFAVMLCRWLKIDASSFSTELRFLDGEAIPAWAYDSVKAVVSLGLIQGSLNAEGLCFLPQEPVTRAQAAVILGRTMPGGRMMADLPWPDADEIPVWSRPYVAELAFMGVMTGNGQTFDPNGPLTRAQAAKLLSELT